MLTPPTRYEYNRLRESRGYALYQGPAVDRRLGDASPWTERGPRADPHLRDMRHRLAHIGRAWVCTLTSAYPWSRTGRRRSGAWLRSPFAPGGRSGRPT